jgi:uncharacterized protein with NRDE domain
MCTLLVHVPEKPRDSFFLGANRDEAFDRPSDGPRWLTLDPNVWGGRDREAGGTWLCARVTTPSRLVAVLNRPPRPGSDPHAPPPPGTTQRSRGLLCVAAARAASLALAEDAAREQVEAYGSAPFNLFVAEAGAVRVAAFDGESLGWRSLAPGWHALTHGEADDPADPRVARALAEVAKATPSLEMIARVLCANEGEGAACRHGERYGTVSSTLVRAELALGAFTWRYASGPPCRTPYVDFRPAAHDRAEPAE